MKNKEDMFIYISFIIINMVLIILLMMTLFNSNNYGKFNQQNQFTNFRIIDDDKKKLGMSNFCSKWTYNYRGGELEERLKNLASKIMYNEYEKNMSNYVKDPETKKRIEGNEGLLLHMSYATWNGPGHFQKFAKKLEDAVKAGKSDEELLDIAKDGRTNTFTGAWAKATTKVNSLIDKASSSDIA